MCCADATRKQDMPRSQIIFDSIVKRIMSQTLLPLQSASVKRLTFDLVDAMLLYNYEIRDTLKGRWLASAGVAVV